MDIYESLLPKDHTHSLLDEIEPEFRFKEGADFSAWRENAEKRLSSLLGLDKIAKRAVMDPKFEIEYEADDAEDGWHEIRFTFFSEKNVKVIATYVRPLGAEQQLPLAICVQGHATGAHNSLNRPKYPGDKKYPDNGDRDFAARAVREGISAVALEQRCFGDRGATPEGHPDCGEASLRDLLLGRCLIGERVWDISRTIDMMEAHFADEFDHEKIICMGNSGGGTATVYATAMDQRIALGVPSCAVSRFADSIGAMYHCNCNYVPGIAEYFDMGELCGMAAPRKMVVVSGAEDNIFPIGGASECFDEAKKIFTAAGVPDNCVHVVGPEGHRFYADLAWKEMKKYLNL